MADQVMRYAIEAEDKTKAALTSATTGIRGFARQAATVAAGFATYDTAKKAASFLADGLKEIVAAANESLAVETQLNAVLASTGGAAGVTAEQAKNLASSLQEVTTYDDESILSAENLILTFTRIGKDVFPQTTQAVLDMSTAMGTDLKSSSILVGKALNDPITGLTALTRVGVSFTDQQKEQIKTLDETGKRMEAQKIILDELATEFGGSAAMKAQTFEGKMKQLNNTIGDIKENIGKAMLPALDLLATDVTQTANAAKKATDNNDLWSRSFYSLVSGIKGAILIIEGLVKAVITIGSALVGTVVVVGAFVYDVIRGFQKVQEAGRDMAMGIVKALTGDFSGAMDSFKNGLNVAKSIDLGATKAAFNGVKGLVGELASSTAASFKAAGAAMSEGVVQKGFKPIEAASAKTMTKLADDAGKAAGKISEAMKKATQDIRDSASGAQEKIANLIDSYGQKTEDNLEKHLDKIKDLNDKISQTQNDYAASSLQEENDYNARRLDLFMGHQDKMNDLIGKSQDLRTQLSSEEDAQKRFILQQQVTETQQAIQKEQAIIDQNAELASQATKYRQTSDLERLKAAHDQKILEDKKAFDEKMASIQLEIDQENAEYAKQTERLRADTASRFDQILAEYKKGYEKIITESKAKGKELLAIQAQAKIDMDQLIAIATTSLGIVSGTQRNTGTAKSSVGPQFNFTFNGAVTDKDSLVKTVIDAVNRANAVASAAKAW